MNDGKKGRKEEGTCSLKGNGTRGSAKGQKGVAPVRG